MRAHLIVSALFAVSLFGGAALADEGARARTPIAREGKLREVLRARGEVVERKERPARVREARAIERSVERHAERRVSSGSRSCAVSDSCSRGRAERPAARTERASATKQSRSAAADQLRAQRLRDRLIKTICEKRARGCGDHL